MERAAAKTYCMILADQSWDINRRGKYGIRSAESHYELMSLDRIKAMPVAEVRYSETSCVLVWETISGMRLFLIQLGFIGDEYKAAWKILFLTGNSSWKTGHAPERTAPDSVPKSPGSAWQIYNPAAHEKGTILQMAAISALGDIRLMHGYSTDLDKQGLTIWLHHTVLTQPSP